MIAEIGLFSLVIALMFAFLLVTIPSVGLWRQKMPWVTSAALYARGLFIFVALSYSCLSLCFLKDDFSVAYVLANSSSSLPWLYKLCAVWGGHEGSMLLWVTILSVWMIGVSLFSAALDKAMYARVLIVLGLLSIGFLLFLLTTSNPFMRQFVETQGHDLNPLLQDPGFLFHPPMLYMGYVGFSVAFAFAMAALWTGRIESSWAKWTRPWTLGAWCCLTAGITLGSWWAYRELGWGGWWFWDPVENASFMPWLVGTALLHSLAVSEQRQQFQAWTLLLAIMAFSLSLIGTFLVRSGVLTSVHAFAVDPSRGLFILCFLLLVIGGALLLFAIRAQGLQKPVRFELFSRESALLLNNVFLVVAMLTVLLGTLYPLLIDALGLGKLSVGSPYFNAVFVPLVIPLLALMGIGIHLHWFQDKWGWALSRVKKQLFLSLFLALGLIFLLGPIMTIYTFLGLISACWIILSTFKLVIIRAQQRGLNNLTRAFWGMILAHCGVAITVIGIAVSSEYGIQKDVKMQPGDKTHLAGFTIQFLEEFALKGANYQGTRTSFAVESGHNVKVVYPEKRIYPIGQMAMTESAIDVSPFRDVYIALGEPLENTAWSVRLYYKPLVRWIWGGGFLILIGGVLALADRRYYRAHQQIKDLQVEI